MMTIRVDEQQIEQIFLEEVKKRLDEIESRQVFWDMKTLCKVTCLSENNIKDKFFYDNRFPKYRVGGKWLFPAKEAEEFLLTWIREQPTN